MKKYLLLLSFLLVSLSAIHAAEGQLNAYAYGAQFAYDPNTQTIAFNWSLPSEASALRIVAIDAQGNKYVLKQYSTTRADAYSSTFSIWEAVDADKLPRNEDLSLAIEVKTADRTEHEVIASKEYTMQSPFSIDIDNNPYSKYFGLKYVTQMDGSSSLPRGVYIFDQTNVKAKDAQLGSGITLPDSWWAGTHGIPHMVRVIPDGSGRLLITSSDRAQDTYMWLAEPSGNGSVPTYTTWKTVITNAQMASWTGLSGGRFANAGFDIRSNGDNWDIILYTADAKDKVQFGAGNIYTGVYSVPKSNSDLTGGTYTTYTTESGGIINQRYTRSMLNASANFDKFGGVLYNAHSDDTDATDPALKHRTLNGDFKDDYADGDLLKRTYVATKGVRFSPDFKKIAIAQNAAKTSGTEIRIYDVAQADGNSHISLSNGVSVDVVTGSSVKAFVHDIAWDHGQNVYITVRNQSTQVDDKYIHGIHAVALDLNGVPVSTPLYTPSGEEYFNIGCTDGQYTVSLGQTGGTGTLTGAGTYDACSKVTVTVTPDNQYKFIRWTEGGVEVSKEKSYSFYLTRNRELTAEFEPAVYNNITWWNLFEKGEDITSPSLDGTRNARLWYLFMPYYNKLSGETLRGIFASHSTGEYNVMAFANTATKNLLTDEDGPLYWLGCYVRHVVVDSTTLLKTYSNYNRCLYAFVNRVGYVKNSSGYQYTNSDTYTTPSCLIDTISRFASQSDSFQWRPWWTRIACDLPSTMTYNDPLPIGWTKIDGPSGADYDTYTDELPTSTSIKLTKTPKWYKWNNWC